ncbi:MAG: von Willebrand factor type A domain-containing protein [Bacteroidetes bacterium]|nr:von Willebrand factor type A domain-containing protein [Bacteroidota bacterium]
MIFMKYIILCSAIVMASLSNVLPDATFVVKGKITDYNGIALPFVSVNEKNTGNIVQSDDLGVFQITVKNSGVILVFTLPGYETKEIKVAGQTMINAVLIKLEDKSEEVVVAPRSKKNELAIVSREEADKSMRVYGMPSPSTYTQRTPPYPGDYNNDNFNTEDYDGIVENRFKTVIDNPLSTFSIDVDAASYGNVRRFLNQGQLPPAGAVRIEEMINYFHYDYPQPTGDIPFAVQTEMSEAPWNKNHRLALVSLQAKKISTENIPASNLVFLIDVSGSMNEENKLPLVQQSMKLLADQLRPQDKVAIVVYAGSAGVVLPATGGNNIQTIKDAINRLEAGGSTAGGEGIKLAYKIASQQFIKEGNNRVILCTDGDFNVGVSSDDEMERMIEQERKSGIFLTVLGYGTGNYKDNKMQKLADKGNGNHAYIDNLNEAKKVLVSEFGGTLFTIAKDVKLQVEFNPDKVQAYRLIGYENRMLNKEDFNNDRKDAGDLGSGQTVTALYEIIPAGVKSEFIERVDPLKYQSLNEPADTRKNSSELMTIKLRYKKPGGDKSLKIEQPVEDHHISLANTSSSFRLAAAVAQFGMLLRHSEFLQQSSYGNVLALASSAISDDAEGYRNEFIQLVQKANSIAKNENHREEKSLGKR